MGLAFPDTKAGSRQDVYSAFPPKFAAREHGYPSSLNSALESTFLPNCRIIQSDIRIFPVISIVYQVKLLQIIFIHLWMYLL